MSVYDISEFKVLANKQLYRNNPPKVHKCAIVIKHVQENKKHLIIGTLVGTIVAGSSLGILNYKINSIKLYHVYLDGKRIGTVNNRALVDIWQSQELRKAQLIYGLKNLELQNSITYQIENKYKGEYDNITALEILRNNLAIEAKGAELIIDGQSYGIVRDKAIIDQFITDLKQGYIRSEGKDGEVTTSSLSLESSEKVLTEKVDIKENIMIHEVKVPPEQIIDDETFLKLIQKEQLTVISEETVTRLEEISFKISYKYDETMFENETKLLKKGVNGQKEVQYAIIKENGIEVEKRLISEDILEQPTDQEMLKGTKAIPAKGSGVLAWPTVGGVITSGYGPRSDSFHYAIDISGVTDDTIKAADNGKIIFTGTKSGYGKTVIIDHGNGIVTLYAHLNEISVAVGDLIAKEQKIGIMGSTGRSTGKHLHFEVLINDEPKNPLNYIGI